MYYAECKNIYQLRYVSCNNYCNNSRQWETKRVHYARVTFIFPLMLVTKDALLYFNLLLGFCFWMTFPWFCVWQTRVLFYVVSGWACKKGFVITMGSAPGITIALWSETLADLWRQIVRPVFLLLGPFFLFPVSPRTVFFNISELLQGYTAALLNNMPLPHNNFHLHSFLIKCSLLISLPSSAEIELYVQNFPKTLR